jgi:hypothetical protein
LGADVGRVLHVVIRGPKDPETGERPQRFAGEVESFETLGRLIKQYNVERAVIDALPETWGHLYLGHFHTYTNGSLNGRWWFANGTTESDNEYAREELSASGVPVQRLQFWSAEHGLVADRPIYLTHGLRGKRAR